MKISHVQPAAPHRLEPSHIAFAACAAVVAVSLLSFYVHLVNQAVERGVQFRYEQQSAAALPVVPKAITASFGGGPERVVARHRSGNPAGAFTAVASSETAVRE